MLLRKEYHINHTVESSLTIHEPLNRTPLQNQCVAHTHGAQYCCVFDSGIPHDQLLGTVCDQGTHPFCDLCARWRRGDLFAWQKNHTSPFSNFRNTTHSVRNWCAANKLVHYLAHLPRSSKLS